MSSDPNNPYAARDLDPKPEKPPLGPGSHQSARERMEYMQAVRFVFDSPNWVMNLIYGGCCILSSQVIPVVGQLVWFGYVFEAAESLLCRPHQEYPDFTLNRFVEYLVRGLWLLLVGVVMMLVVLPIGFLFMLGAIGGLAAVGAASEGDEASVLMVILIVVVILAAVVLELVAAVCITPFMIRAAFSQDLGVSLNLAWARDFIAKMWKEIILAALFSMLVAFVTSLIGFAILCIGVFPANALALMVQGHLALQLYQVYLDRGGEPIPLKAS